MNNDRIFQGDMPECHKYDDMIHLPHPVSRKHKQMSIADRAAQFAPFSALTGLGETLEQTKTDHIKKENER